ncbi:uncharacterized protein [Gossypium hirsutum]|uniref:DUF7745 domain-containing protein n=1 Tax=Gossypium hirsutum TaxID=3635 RepID=A0ABM3A931_GOSHI|nr:uncharacterized protein LOC121218329 [Gossypium hirsutum]
MKNKFLDKVKDNAFVQRWSENAQLEKGDSLTKEYTSDLWDFTRISVVDRYLFSAMAQFWNSAYSCFTFGKVDLAPTIEEYTALLRCPRFQWVEARVQQKGSRKCIPWENLRDLILTHPDMKKRVDVFALSIYGLVIFPKALRHVDEAVADLFDRLGKGVTPVPAILAETFRSLSVCRRSVIVAISRKDDITEEKWMAILQNLQEKDIEWKAPWMVSDEILYRYESYDWVLFLGIWGAIGYAPLLVLRQYRSRQFIPMTQGLAQSGFLYGEKDSKKKSREIYNAWNHTCRIKRVAVNPMVTPEYNEWRSRRVNDNIPRPNLEEARPIEEYLRVVPSELEIIKQDFEKKTSELERKIEQLEEEKVYLKLDVDVQKSEAENLRMRKREVEEDLDSLKTDYKQLHKSMRNAGLGKTSEQWRQEIQEEKARADWWERNFHDAQAREVTCKKSLDDSQNEKQMLRAQVEELETEFFTWESREIQRNIPDF